MKFVRVLSGAGVTTTLAALAIVGGAGSAQALIDRVSGEGWVGQYWCFADSDAKQKFGWGDVTIRVYGSSFGDQGQTMQFKIIDARTKRTLGWSGWFEIPTVVYRPIAYNVPNGTLLQLCATFGGGNRNVLHKWNGSLSY